MSAYSDAEPTYGLDLWSVPNALLAAVVAAFQANGVPLPERQYVTAGDAATVAWDCAQLVVCLADIGWGRSMDATQLSPTFGKASSVNAMRHATYAIELIRPAPVISDAGQLPSVADMAAAGQALLVDAGLLSQTLVNFVAFGNPAIPLGCNVQAGAVQPIGPEGGLVGLSGALVMTLGVTNDAPAGNALPAGWALQNGSS